MLKENNTPFAAMAFEQRHRDRRGMLVAAVRARYLLQPDGELELSPEQELALSDAYDGSPHATPLVRTTDLVPFKPGTDVTVLGDAHSPEGAAQRSWTAGIMIGEYEHVLTVHGPRRWEPEKGAGRPAWRLAPAQSVDSVALDYRLAAGGRVIGDPKGEADARNPIGAGMIDPKVTSPYFGYDAPQIEADGARVKSTGDRPSPMGFGPVAPVWDGRIKYAGSLTPESTRLPDDFDYRFWRSAPPELQMGGFLAAGTPITLGRLVRGGGVVAFAVPNVEPVAHYTFTDGREVAAAMNRDGVHIDMRGDPPWSVEITFRCWMELCRRSHVVNLSATNRRGAEDLPRAGIDGLADKAPA